jgi:hypothetical protein
VLSADLTAHVTLWRGRLATGQSGSLGVIPGSALRGPYGKRQCDRSNGRGNDHSNAATYGADECLWRRRMQWKRNACW